MSLTTIINYCSIDSRFIEKNIEQCSIFSDEIIISCFPIFLAERTPDVNLQTSLKNVLKNKKVKLLLNEPHPEYSPRYHHNLARINGWKLAKDTSDYILFLDADEIPEGILVKLFLQNYFNYYNNCDVIQFGCYYYFREPEFRSIEFSGCGALWKTQSITEEVLTTDKERWGYRHWDELKIPRLRFKEEVLLKGTPLFHHYSWVRSKEEMIKKVKNWGHTLDKNWEALIEEEFSRPFNGTDFYGKKYEIVNNDIGI